MTRKTASGAPIVGALILAVLAVVATHPVLAQQKITGWPAQLSNAANSASLSLLPAVAYLSGGFPSTSVAVADVNGDGRLDVVVANGESLTNPLDGSVSVLLGNSDGTLQPPITYSSGGRGSAYVAIADVNGDGRMDLVVANSCYGSDCSTEGSVGVLFGNGDGTFQSPVVYGSGGAGAISIAVVDLNRDGRTDLVVANFCSTPPCPGDPGSFGNVSVLLGNGDGTFQAPTSYNSGGVRTPSIAIADLNGDGHLDVTVTNECLPSNCGTAGAIGMVGVMLGNGDGTIQAAVNYSSGSGAYSVVIDDVNSDGYADAVVGGSDGRPNPRGTVSVLLGNGDGTFRTPVVYRTNAYQVADVAIGDLNGDGHLDVAAASECQNAYSCNPGIVSVLLGKGDGTFQPGVTFSSGGVLSLSVAIADLNADGRPDLVVANDAGLQNSLVGDVAVLLNNSTCSTTPPVITLSTTSTSLWPPNGKMVPITFSGTITDTGSACTVKTVVYAVKDEYGKVQPSGSVTLRSGGAYSLTVLLQASRLGTDLDGRHYTITVSATNNAGKTGSQAGTVIVPHDKGH